MAPVHMIEKQHTKQTHLTIPGYHGKPRHLAQTQCKGRSVEARITELTPASDFLPEKHTSPDYY